MEELLEHWGVAAGPEEAVGLTLTGRELVVTEYGDHAITRNLKKVTTMFYMPRALEPLGDVGPVAEIPADKPRVTVLASSTADGWAEADLSQTPPRYDPGVDRPGPVPIVLAVEKGAVGEIDVEIRPTRLVVMGDSDFVSNGALRSGVGGNRDFFMSALNWLLEREALLAISAKAPWELRLDMDRRRMRMTFLLIVGAMPALAAFAGVVVWQRRKH